VISRVATGGLRQADNGAAPVSTGTLLRELYLNRVGLLFLLMALVSVGMLYAAARTHGTSNQVWLALGTSILATTIYSFFQVLLTRHQLDRFLRSSIRGELAEGQEAIRRQIAAGESQLVSTYREIHRQFVPNAQYPSLLTPGDRFNRDLNQSLRTSDHYTFRGVTGQYAVTRLALLHTVPSEFRLIIADPTKPAAVDSRVRRSAANHVEVARQELLDGIYQALVGVCLIRHKFDHVQICLTADPHIERLEVTDDAIFLTRFSDVEDPASRFPSTMRFARESLIYQIYSRDCARLAASPYVTHFDLPKLGLGEYAQFLTEHAVPVSADRLESLRRTFLEFKDQVGPDLVPG
jgi:hypothetical protein